MLPQLSPRSMKLYLIVILVYFELLMTKFVSHVYLLAIWWMSIKEQWVYMITNIDLFPWLSDACIVTFWFVYSQRHVFRIQIFCEVLTPLPTCYVYLSVNQLYIFFSEDKNQLNKVSDAVRTNFNDRVDEVRNVSIAIQYRGPEITRFYNNGLNPSGGPPWPSSLRRWASRSLASHR